MYQTNQPRHGDGGADVEAEKASGDGDGFSFVTLPITHDTLCGRCNGPAGPEGAWCDNCIRACREYTLRLDKRGAA